MMAPINMQEIYGSDAYSPKEIAERIEAVGVRKAQLPLLPMTALGVLAGGFIGLGALFFNLVASDPDLGFAAKRVLGGVVFSPDYVATDRVVAEAGGTDTNGDGCVRTAGGELSVSTAASATVASGAGNAVTVRFRVTID